MCPAEHNNILLFLQPPQPFYKNNSNDSIGAKARRLYERTSARSTPIRVTPIRSRSPREHYFRSKEQQYPELVTIRPQLLRNYPDHTILYGRHPLTKEEGSAAIQNPFSADAKEFAYGALFTAIVFVNGKRKRVGYFPPIRQPKPRKNHLLKAAIRKLENMTSQRDFALATQTGSQGDGSTRDPSPDRDEKRREEHKMMLEHHENAIEDGSEDEGGIPAWIAMRRAIYDKRITPNGKYESEQSSACASRTQSPRRRASADAADRIEDKNQGGLPLPLLHPVIDS